MVANSATENVSDDSSYLPNHAHGDRHTQSWTVRVVYGIIRPTLAIETCNCVKQRLEDTTTSVVLILV